jgi:hypothetical protein
MIDLRSKRTFDDVLTDSALPHKKMPAFFILNLLKLVITHSPTYIRATKSGGK